MYSFNFPMLILLQGFNFCCFMPIKIEINITQLAYITLASLNQLVNHKTYLID